jgi:hypothetical protein
MLADAEKYETALANDDKRRASELYEQTGQANKPALMRLPYMWRCPVDGAHLVQQTCCNSPRVLQVGNKLDRFLNLHAPGKRELTNAVENRRNKRARKSGPEKTNRKHLFFCGFSFAVCGFSFAVLLSTGRDSPLREAEALYMENFERHVESIKSWHITPAQQRQAGERFVSCVYVCPPGWFRKSVTPWRGTLKLAEKYKICQYDLMSYCLRDITRADRLHAFQGVCRVIRVATNGPIPSEFVVSAARAVVVEEDVLPITEHYEQGHQLVHMVFTFCCLSHQLRM